MKHISLIHSLQIGHRIYALVGALLIFIAAVGGTGVYKMTIIGHELEEVADRNLPLTLLLEKITAHQLEQAIMLERGLRFKGVTAHKEDETFESIVTEFDKLAKKTDEELHDAEKMVKDALATNLSPEARAEYELVLGKIIQLEEQHLVYEEHIEEIFTKLSSPSVDVNSAELSEKVTAVEEEQHHVNVEIEGLMFEVSGFTQKSAEKALADERRGIVLIATISGVSFVLGLILAIVLSRSVTGPLNKLTGAMSELADGNLDTPIPSATFKDEVSKMSDAMTVFQANMQRTAKLEAEQKELQAEQEAERKKRQQRQNELNQLVGIFGSTIGAVFSQILTSSKDMVGQAGNMLSQSTDSQAMAKDVATEAEQSAANAQSLSSATEEMVASIKEIAQQVTRSAEVTKQAVEFSQTSENDVKQLQQISREIGEVVSLITDIAEQTNLLALNATIEAARAGEAGKGFAVVASEVKSLANATAKATDEISLKIQSIQTASGQSAESIGQIGKIISDIDQYVSAIMAAIEEQNAVTEEIARNVQFVSDSSERVSGSVQKIQSQSSEVSQSSQAVTENADGMAQEADMLSKEVKTFLDAMQNTDVNDDTYEPRKVSVPANAVINGSTWSGQVSEISAAHVVVTPAMAYDAGQTLEITLDGIEETLSARIAKSEDQSSTIQFPLDLDHMDKMKGHISRLV